MSIRAYLFTRKQIKSDKEGFKKYEIYEATNEFFNLTHTTFLINLFKIFGYDNTNHDLIGQLELTIEGLEDFLHESAEITKNWTDYDMEVLHKIIKYFENNDILNLECY